MSTEIFQVEGMSCGHCVKAVTHAIAQLDGSAQVKVDLEQGQVEVETTQPRATVAEAIRTAGYTVA